MAKATKSEGEETTSSYFRKVFTENPKWLWGRSNQAVLDRWLTDHGETEVPNKIKQNLANIKSVLRKKKGRRGRKAKGAAEEVAVLNLNWEEPDTVPPVDPVTVALEQLEEHIDEGLGLAKTLDREGLQEVITLLRRARNAVVWKLGS